MHTHIAAINKPSRHIVHYGSSSLEFLSSAICPRRRRLPLAACHIAIIMGPHMRVLVRWNEQFLPRPLALVYPSLFVRCGKTLCIFQLITIIELFEVREVRSWKTFDNIFYGTRKVQGHFHWVVQLWRGRGLLPKEALCLFNLSIVRAKIAFSIKLHRVNLI